MNNVLNIFKKYLYAHVIFLIFMSMYRFVFFVYYNPLDSLKGLELDIINAFILGFRIDLTVIGYIQALPTLFLIILYFINKEKIFVIFEKLSTYYLFVMYLLVTLLLCADFGFYSYFKDHINILFFGLLDDDTKALMVTFWQNYNVVLILSIFFVYIAFLFIIIQTIFKKENEEIKFTILKKVPILTLLFFLILNFLAIRGTLGMYPLGKMIPTVSENKYINLIPQNGFRAFTSAYKVRKKFLKRDYDLIKETGFKGKIEEAFRIHTGKQNIDTKNLLNNITYKTKKVDDKEYNVVVIMVESFGLPITKFNSESFNILGSLKKHFDEDILFTNFISSGDGTIPSLESLLLNIPYRPGSFPFSQSNLKQTSFSFSPAFLYSKNGYETSFIYGGDLSWRDIGKFVSYQGYKNVEGKIDIYNSLVNKKKAKDEYFHPWGIYDEYLYEDIFSKLENAKQKQFIFALSTNNHPPYNVPNDYNTMPLEFNDSIKKSLTGDLDLVKQRFTSYQYAVNSVGKFLTKFKKSNFSNDTIVVITADNNTIDGIMKYKNNQLLNSKNIPLYMYIPKELKNSLSIDTEVAGSHKDIFPTLYNLTLDRKEYISIGKNLLNSNYKKIGFNGSNIINTNNGTKKVKSFKDNDEDVNYYKASLAITQYLINKEKNKNK